MKKGIVMDMDDAFLTLLTPEGEFLRARRQEHSCEIGEEIQFSPVAMHDSIFWRLSKKDLLKHKPIWAVSVAAALLIFLGSLLPMYQENKAYAYMSIDGSSSIELGINQRMLVIELKGFNKEGKNVIAHISNWKNKEAFQIAQTILAEMKKEGYLRKNNSVTISTVLIQQPVATANEKLKENLNEIKQAAEKEKFQIYLINGKGTDSEKTAKQESTTGKNDEVKNNSSINKQETENQNQNQEEPKQAQTQEGNLKQNSQNQGNSTPAMEPVIPPGQLKKIEVIPVIPAQNKNESNRDHNLQSESNLPPGLSKFKKHDQTKINFGQFKKEDYQNNQGVGNEDHKKEDFPKKHGHEFGDGLDSESHDGEGHSD